jgi:hypothetical protein
LQPLFAALADFRDSGDGSSITLVFEGIRLGQPVQIFRTISPVKSEHRQRTRSGSISPSV